MSEQASRPPGHYNPPPKFGLQVARTFCRECGCDMGEDPNDNLCEFCFDAEMSGGVYSGDGWCVECGDEFHLDDCGGYNPPCVCGAHCRSCHEAEVYDSMHGDDDYDEQDER